MEPRRGGAARGEILHDQEVMPWVFSGNETIRLEDGFAAGNPARGKRTRVRLAVSELALSDIMNLEVFFDERTR
jgi:hypothetical protein